MLKLSRLMWTEVAPHVFHVHSACLCVEELWELRANPFIGHRRLDLQKFDLIFPVEKGKHKAKSWEARWELEAGFES